MNTAEFLFPSDLEITPTPIKRVLLIGSCLSDMYGSMFQTIKQGVAFDRILFNNAYDLPSHPPHPVESYDLQYIQIPLRSVLTDGIISATNLQNSAFIADIVEAAKRNLDAMLDTALSYNKASGLLTFVANFIVPQVRVAPSMTAGHTAQDLTYLVQELNLHLAGSLKQHQSVYYADVDSIAGSLGKRYFLDDAIYFYSHNAVMLPYAADEEHMPHWTAPERGRIEDIPPLPSFYENRMDEFFAAVYRQIEAGYRIVHQLDQVKLVIFDLDNTLWRGQIAEHYEHGRRWPHSDGWPLGLWEAVHQLRWRGIVTSIASKNDPELVARRWDEVVQPPFLKLADFVHPQIGWDPKAESIARIMQAVNVTARSTVFVDDNPVERESVRAAFPAMRVIGQNPFLTRRALLWSAETQVATVTTESARRESMIRGQIDREVQKTAMSREAFLASLQCRVTLLEIAGVNQPAFTRALELVNKTNQFNTTGERWSVASVRSFLAGGGRLVAFSVADRFVDYGLVGVLFVQGTFIRQYVMSCRVLGMEVEVAVVAAVVAALRAGRPEAPLVTAQMIHTGANGPCHEVYARSGFRAAAEPQTVELAAGAEPKAAAHVAITWVAPPLVAPTLAEQPAAEAEPAPSTAPSVDEPQRFPPAGEVFNGAAFFDGFGIVPHAGAGGWVIAAGQTGRFTYLRYHHPVPEAASLAGRTARFTVVLVTTPDIVGAVTFGTDFTAIYSSIGVPGESRNAAVVQTSPTTLTFSWDYTFTGEETGVIGALQVVSDRAVDHQVSTLLHSQSCVMLGDASAPEPGTQPEQAADMAGLERIAPPLRAREAAAG